MTDDEMKPKTIDIQMGAELFREADPVGLIRDASARRFHERLEARVREIFPKAKLFLRWSPSRTDEPDIYTIPRVREAEARLTEVVEGVREEESDEWLLYDQSVRAAFSF